MTTIIIITIIVAILYFVIKAAMKGNSQVNKEQQTKRSTNSGGNDTQYKKTSPEEMQAAKERHSKAQQVNVNQKPASKEVSFPPSEQGYSYHEMVGMYHRGVTPSDFGAYEGRAVAETNNPHDKFAVGIYRNRDNKLVGYIPKEERGESNEYLHRKILYNGGSAKAVFKIQGSAQRSYGTVYIKEGYKIFRNGDAKSPYKSKGVKEFQFEAFKGVNGNHKCLIKIDSPTDEYDYTVSIFSESGDLIGQTDNNELKLFDYIEERGSDVLSWCYIDADAKSGILYVPLNLTEKAIHQKLDAFLVPVN